MEENKVLLSIKDLDVKFKVRGRTLTAIRGISLDIYENESIAIVGESGSGKSVFTKTFAGMLDSNGYIDNGSIIFSDDELSDTVVKLDNTARSMMDGAKRKLDEYAHLELGASTYQKILELEREKKEKSGLSGAELEAQEAEIKELEHLRTDVFNMKQTLDPAKEKDKIRQANQDIKKYDEQIKDLRKKNEQLAQEKKRKVDGDAAYQKSYQDRMNKLQEQYKRETAGQPGEKALKRNEILAKEIYLSVGRYSFRKRSKCVSGLLDALKKGFGGYEELRQFLFDCEKFGNHRENVDREAAAVAGKTADMVAGKMNYLGNPFRPDFSTPSTHLIYGSLVGAMPSGRKAGEMLNYGYTAIANYESGRNQPSIPDLKKIASIFNVSMDYLLGVNDIRHPYVIDDNSAKFNEFRRFYALLNEDSKSELLLYMQWLVERENKVRSVVYYEDTEEKNTVQRAAQEPEEYR